MVWYKSYCRVRTTCVYLDSILLRGNKVIEQEYDSYAAWYAANVDAITISGGTLQPPSYLLPIAEQGGRDPSPTSAVVIPFPARHAA